MNTRPYYILVKLKLMKMSDNYLRNPGAYHAKVTGNKVGEDNGKITWVLFYVTDTNSGYKANCMFFMPRDKDSTKASTMKKKMLKDFLTNLGCDMDLKGMDLINDSTNREAKIVFRSKEKMILGKKDGKPIVINNIEYYWSNPLNKLTEPNPSKLYAKMNDWETNRYNETLKEWEKKNGSTPIVKEKEDIDYTSTIKTEKVDDELPF